MPKAIRWIGCCLEMDVKPFVDLRFFPVHLCLDFSIGLT